MSDDKTTTVVEEYLLTIRFFEKYDKKVKAIKLSEHLKSSPSTVHATLSRMQRDKLITLGPKKEILLTDQGREKAISLSRRHQIVETFLADTLGIPWYEVHKHAHKLEHALTPLIEERLEKFLNYPETCPHGSPIPGTQGEIPEEMFFLDEAKIGMKVKVVLVNELLEENEDQLKYLHENLILPGETHEVHEINSLGIHLIKESNKVVLPNDVADKVGVVELDSE